MNTGDRVDRWLTDLRATLDAAADLVTRGRDEFDADPALPFAFETLSNRVGDLAKRLASTEPARFDDPLWSQAARNRDFVVHHHDRLDTHALWVTVSRSFQELRRVVNVSSTNDRSLRLSPHLYAGSITMDRSHRAQGHNWVTCPSLLLTERGALRMLI